MNNIIPFNEISQSELANLQAAFAADTSLVVSGGFPSLSIKGSKFAITRNGEREVIKKDGNIASAIELCVIAYNPNISKVFYEAKYEDGSNEKPDCYSNDGKAPSKNAEKPQAKNCATCAHNQWGSRVTDSGKKAKACSDSRRIAVASPSQLNEPMLLRVPPTSMKPLGEYQRMLANRKLAMQAVVTQISFDENSSSPLLTFKPVGFCGTDMLKEILSVKDDQTVLEITGIEDVGFIDEHGSPEDLSTISKPVEVAAPVAVPKAAKVSPPKVEVVAEADDDDAMFANIDAVMSR